MIPNIYTLAEAERLYENHPNAICMCHSPQYSLECSILEQCKIFFERYT